MLLRRVVMLSVLAAAPAALATGTGHLITQSSIGGGALGQSRAAYAKAYGKALRTDRLEQGLTRVSYPGRVDAYFGASKRGIAIVVSGTGFRTAKGVAPCSTASAVRRAYPGAVRVALAGPEYAYRLGSSLWIEIEGGKVAAIALGTKQAAFFAANTTACGSH
ncbi:MAG: hypothetical protein ACXVY8_06730 [Gaiellaceae bacterium]